MYIPSRKRMLVSQFHLINYENQVQVYETLFNDPSSNILVIDVPSPLKVSLRRFLIMVQVEKMKRPPMKLNLEPSLLCVSAFI